MIPLLHRCNDSASLCYNPVRYSVPSFKGLGQVNFFRTIVKHVTQFLKNGTKGANRCKCIDLAVPLAVPRGTDGTDIWIRARFANRHRSTSQALELIQSAKSMMRFNSIESNLAIWFSCLVFAAACLAQSPADYTRWVNPFIGTGGHGHTFPGATVPFGMVQLSPDTRIDNWDGSSGYHYSDNIIYGFSHTHLSGTGIPDGCDILFMPTQTKLHAPEAKPDEGPWPGYGSKFSHVNEKAEPGYYSVKLDDDDILAELTTTERVGFHRYTFSKSVDTAIRLDLNWRDKRIESDIRVVNDTTVEGFRRSTSWAKGQKVYFVAQFSKPFRYSTQDTIVTPSTALPRGGGMYAWASFSFGLKFDVNQDKVVMLKVAISYVSIEGARKNLEAELPHWDFDKVRAQAKAAWNKELSKIEVSGGMPEQTTNFYTALYHTMIHPNVFNDVDGRYLGHDRKIHQLPGYELQKPARQQGLKSEHTSKALANAQASAPDHYTVFSLWDTFRAAHPLYTIIDQKRTVDFINSFIRMYEQGGRLPVWELWGEETDTMIGYHAVSVVADAMAKGIKGFDYEKAYAAAKHSADLDHFGLAAYKRRGYISMEDENESVSRTLEYAYNDWCIAQMALALHNKYWREQPKRSGPVDASSPRGKVLADARRYLARARNYENLFDTRTHFFRPKKNGGFVRPFAPNEVTFGFTEGNSWQYSFFVPHDVSRLMELMGGRSAFAEKLDELFTTGQKLAGREQADLTGLIGQYAQGNEPSHHIAYLYSYAAEPWKTQKYVRKILDGFYRNAPDGLIGNEDCGQMSAWYVLSASGLYPVNPGDGIYTFGTPLFPEMKYRLENGRTFTVRAKNVGPDKFYIGEATLNGVHHTKAFITHADITSGGTLEFAMTGTPAQNAFGAFPVSSAQAAFVAVPSIEGERVFDDRAAIFMRTPTYGADIYYTIDGSEPTAKSQRYLAPIRISSDAVIKAVAVWPNGERSKTAEATFHKKPNDWKATVTSGYSTQYTGGGENAIVDGIRGTTNFASGEWQGIQGKPYEAVVDLQRSIVVREVGASFLQIAGPWIWLPATLKFETSTDGVSYTTVATKETEHPLNDMKPRRQEYLIGLSSAVLARYLRITATNIGKIPSWHPGAGGDPWIFIDEVIIR
jgi:putative alpha-1,2-mannosidase